MNSVGYRTLISKQASLFPKRYDNSTKIIKLKSGQAARKAIKPSMNE